MIKIREPRQSVQASPVQPCVSPARCCSTCSCEMDAGTKSRLCKTCHAANMREWRKTHRLEGDALIKARTRSYAKTYLKRGYLTKEPCSVCKEAHSEMHHEDYTKPLEVIWLCRQCHLDRHHSAAGKAGANVMSKTPKPLVPLCVICGKRQIYLGRYCGACARKRHRALKEGLPPGDSQADERLVVDSFLSGMSGKVAALQISERAKPQRVRPPPLKIPRPPRIAGAPPKRWTADDATTLDAACSTGRLPDGRIATQMRLALCLGFSRATIVVRLAGRRLPMCNEVMRAGGIASSRKRAMDRMNAIRMSIKSRDG